MWLRKLALGGIAVVVALVVVGFLMGVVHAAVQTAMSIGATVLLVMVALWVYAQLKG